MSDTNGVVVWQSANGAVQARVTCSRCPEATATMNVDDTVTCDGCSSVLAYNASQMVQRRHT